MQEMTKLACAFLAILLFVTPGCQPTPEEKIVVSKGDGTLEEKVAAGAPEGYHFEIPQGFTRTYKYLDGIYTIDFDENSRALMPDVDKYPVYEATIGGFSKETAQKVVDQYFGDMELNTGKDQLTKDDINKMLLEYKQKLFELENDIYEHPADDPNPTPDIPSIKMSISILEDMLKSAPDGQPPTPVSLDSYNGKYFSSSIKMSNGNTGRITITDMKLEIANNHKYLSADAMSSINYSPEGFIAVHNRNIEVYGDTGEVLSADYDFGISYSREEAISMAQEFVDALGVDYMKYAFVGVQKPSVSNSEYENDKSNKYLYGVLFMRELDGIPFSRAAANYTLCSDVEDPGNVAKAYYYERMLVYIGNEGIEAFVWTSPLKIERKLADSVRLISFEDILKRSADVCYQITDPNRIISYKSKIQTVEFGYSMLRRKDADGIYLLIPTWDVYAEYEHCWEDFETPYATVTSTNGGITHVNSQTTINAIDGSRIDRHYGY